MDTERADALVGEICQLLLDDPEVAEHNWDSLAFAAVMREPMSIYGYRYLGSEAFPTTPLTIEMVALLQDLQAATVEPDGSTWGACMIQIDGAELDFQIDFETENPEKWRLTPDNFETQAMALKPKFDLP